MKRKNKHIGSSFDSFLKDEGILDEAHTSGIKRVISFQMQKEMKKSKITKSTMAKMMRTSRSSLERLLDPDNQSITLLSLSKAAAVLGKKLKVSLA
jgi:antitoxin HicB